MAERARPDLASAMFPNLSREVRAREAALERQAAENQRRNAMLLADLKALNRSIKRLQQSEQKEI
jgi:hypothetical protein